MKSTMDRNKNAEQMHGGSLVTIDNCQLPGIPELMLLALSKLHTSTIEVLP